MHKFVILDNKDVVRGQMDDQRDVNKEILKLANSAPGVKFFTYGLINEFSVPTAEQKERDAFWK